MKLPWQKSTPTTGIRGTPGRADAAPGVQSCPSIARVLEKILKRDNPEILDLGAFCGDTAVYLAGRGTKVSVESFQPPLPVAKPKGKLAKPPPAPPLRIEQADARFDFVLAWEHLDFTPPERLGDLGAELYRVLAPGGWLILFAANKSLRGEVPEAGPSRYRLIADDQVVREEISGERRQRWVHPTREIERALAPLSIQGIHLQRNQIREFIAVKKES